MSKPAETVKTAETETAEEVKTSGGSSAIPTIFAIIFFLTTVALGILYFLKKCATSPTCPTGQSCQVTGAATTCPTGGFKALTDIDISNDSALPNTLTEKEETISQCIADCQSDATCFSFSLEQRPDLASQGKVKCWFKNTNKASNLHQATGVLSFVKI
jgi:hypothetical protein